jgi:hypothetical protein
MKTKIDFWSYLAQFFLEWDVSDITCRENKTHVFNNFFSFENRSVYEIIWNNTVEPDRPLHAWYQGYKQNTICSTFHCNSGCKVASQSYVMQTYISCLITC